MGRASALFLGCTHSLLAVLSLARALRTPPPTMPPCSVYSKLIAHGAVHAGFAGYTACAVGQVRSHEQCIWLGAGVACWLMRRALQPPPKSYFNLLVSLSLLLQR